MAFTIYSQITNPANVVSVQTDEHGTFQVIGRDAGHAAHVNLGYVQVHVSGPGIAQQPARYVGAHDGSKFKVELMNNQPRIQPAG